MIHWLANRSRLANRPRDQTVHGVQIVWVIDSVNYSRTLAWSHTMVFNNDDRILIKELRMAKGCGAKRFLKEFPLKNWSLAGLNRLIKNIDEYGSADRRPGSGWCRTARTDDNIAVVQELVMSQDSQPGTHRSLSEIASEVGVSKATVHRIVHRDLALNAWRKKERKS